MENNEINNSSEYIIHSQCREWIRNYTDVLDAFEMIVSGQRALEEGYYLTLDGKKEGHTGKTIELTLFKNGDVIFRKPILTLFNKNEEIFRYLYSIMVDYYIKKYYSGAAPINMRIATWNWALGSKVENEGIASTVSARLYGVTDNDPELKRIFISLVGCHNAVANDAIRMVIRDLGQEIHEQHIVDDLLNKSINNTKELLEDLLSSELFHEKQGTR